MTRPRTVRCIGESTRSVHRWRSYQIPIEDRGDVGGTSDVFCTRCFITRAAVRHAKLNGRKNK